MATHAWRVTAAEPVEQRGAERRGVTITRATVREHGQEPRDARLVDLSIYGCRIDVAEDHDEGERLWLRLDGGWPIAATVVWARDGRLGCRFDEPIPGSLLRDLTRALS